MRLPPYPRYKPSGFDWLGDVPEHWNVVPLKHRCNRTALYGANISGEEYALDGVRFLRTTDIDDFGNLQPGGVFIEPVQAQGYVLDDGDILLSRSGTIGRAFVFWSHRHPPSAYAGYLVRFVPSFRLNPSLFFYFTKSTAFRDWLDTQVIASTIGNVNGQKYAQCPVPLAEREEQRAIADFLDRETAKIDTLVAKKRTLIERLKEKRTALISRTVTRGLPPDAARAAGLDPHPKLKPSGIDWLGDVPEHWDVVPLKWKARCASGDGIAAEDVANSAEAASAIPVIGGNGLMGFTARFNVGHPVVVIGRVGALCGNVHEVDAPAWVTDNALILEADERAFDRAYLAAVLRTRNLNEIADKTAQPLITGTQVRDQRLPRPPLKEQQVIAHILASKTARIDSMVAKVETAIERLQEYRTALITAAVTGKIDVRGAGA